MILVGDIGGTNTRLALADADHAGVSIQSRTDYPSRGAPGLTALVEQFLKTTQNTPTAACFGIAGPIEGDRCAATNLPWVIDAAELRSLLNTQDVTLLNDLEAAAHGVATLTPHDYAVVHEGEPGHQGNAAVVAAGTGLGIAAIHWDGSKNTPFATEGGHADFAPRNDLEVDLYRHLRDRFGRVTYERVASGPGLVNIFEFLRDTNRFTQEPWLAEAMHAAVYHGEIITKAAVEHTSPLCEKTVEIFLAVYGAQAGNAALQYLARAGVWLAGGIAPALLEDGLDFAPFVTAFLDKAPYESLLRAVPVRAVTDGSVALKGAAAHALEKATTNP